MSEPGESAEDRAYRRGFKRSHREDYAVDRFREARANLHDVARVNRILPELGRYYNAIADAPLVTLETRQRIVGCSRLGVPTRPAGSSTRASRATSSRGDGD